MTTLCDQRLIILHSAREAERLTRKAQINSSVLCLQLHHHLPLNTGKTHKLDAAFMISAHASPTLTASTSSNEDNADTDATSLILPQDEEPILLSGSFSDLRLHFADDTKGVKAQLNDVDGLDITFNVALEVPLTCGPSSSDPT